MHEFINLNPYNFEKKNLKTNVILNSWMLYILKDKMVPYIFKNKYLY